VSRPAVPYQAYLALAGATAELVRAEVRRDRIRNLTALEDTLLALHLAILAARPWHAGQPPAGLGPRHLPTRATAAPGLTPA
jgi:hypothetical protein